jgi:hypothetical protein
MMVTGVMSIASIMMQSVEMATNKLVREKPAPLIFYKYASIAADHIDHN